MTRRTVALLALVTLALVTGCTEDDPIDSVRFTIFIDNTTATDYDVWESSDVVTDPFVRVSSVDAQQTVALRDRLIGIEYILRLVPRDGPVDQFDYEMSFTSTGADQTWRVP